MPRYSTRLIAREMIAAGTLVVRLERPAGFQFVPGQYADLALIEPPETDDAGNLRSLSIASAPSEPALLFATRIRDSAFKRVLARLPLGTSIRLSGPSGSFRLHADPGRPAVFLAGGIGITPFVSMIKHAAAEEPSRPLVLFYANRRPEEAAFLDELRALARAVPGFRLVPTVTDTTRPADGWDGETGRIDRTMLAKHVDDLADPAYYIAGPEAMVSAVQAMLRTLGIPEDHIRSEEFPGY